MPNDSILISAAQYWTNRYSKPYTYIHSGNIKIRIERESVMDSLKCAVFRDNIKENIKDVLEKSFGYVQIKEDSTPILKALKESHIKLPQGYNRNNSIMFIEDSEVYVYEDGMKKAEKIR